MAQDDQKCGKCPKKVEVTQAPKIEIDQNVASGRIKKDKTENRQTKKKNYFWGPNKGAVTEKARLTLQNNGKTNKQKLST